MASSFAVVIPVYNGSKYLAETIASVLQQDYPAAEILVIEDGSPQPSLACVLPFGDRVRYHPQENAGQAQTRNNGAALTSAEWLCFLDQDDLLLPEHLKLVALAIQNAGEQADLCYTGRKSIFRSDDGSWEESAPAVLPKPAELADDLLLRCSFPPSGVCIRRSAFQAVGGFDSAYKNAEDWELWLRLIRHGCRAIWSPAATVVYRVHESSVSHNPVPILRANLRVVHERLLPGVPLWRRWSLGSRVCSRLEAECAILLRQTGTSTGAFLMFRSILRHPVHEFRRYKIFLHMLLHLPIQVPSSVPSSSRARASR